MPRSLVVTVSDETLAHLNAICDRPPLPGSRLLSNPSPESLAELFTETCARLFDDAQKAAANFGLFPEVSPQSKAAQTTSRLLVEIEFPHSTRT